MSDEITLSRSATIELFGASRQCTAHSRNGERCRRVPIVGGSVCRLHGGASPNAIAAAQRMIQACIEPAVGVLFDLLDNECPACRGPADRYLALRAATALLDRGGLTPSMSVTIASHDTSWGDLAQRMTDDEVTELSTLLDRVKQRIERENAP